MEFIERNIPSNGISLKIAECGSGPLVVFIHGFPGLWYSWRHQLHALADAGYHAVAVDQRGYGGSDRPTEVAAYDSNQVVADMLGLLDFLGEKQAIFVGHDFGSAVAWNLAVRFPQRVAAVVSLSVPYDFDLAGRSGQGESGAFDKHDSQEFAVPGIRPTELFAQIAEQHFIHLHYFQQIGPAEAELGPHIRTFLTRLYWALSQHGNLLNWENYPSQDTGYLDVLEEPAQALPWAWMSDSDMDYYVAQYGALGQDQAFIGGLNSYRCADRNWEIGRAWANANVERPAWYITGREDPVLKMTTSAALDVMKSRVPDLRGIDIIEGAGHFVQMEQAETVNKSLLGFVEQIRQQSGRW